MADTAARTSSLGTTRWSRATTWVARHPLRTWQLAVAALFVLFVAVGATTSSIGAPALNAQVDDPPRGVVLGGPDSIRTDEFMRTTPWAFGLAARGDDSFATPLGVDRVALATRGTGGPVTTILYPETQLLRIGGTTLRPQTFAFAWWLPTVLVLLLLPVWFRQLGAGPAIGIPLTVVVFAAPVSIWWSWGVLNVLGWAVAAAVAACAGVTRWRQHGFGGRALLLLLGAAFAAARLGLAYQPWSIPLAIAVLAPTLVAVLAVRERRLLAAGLSAAVAVVGGSLLGGFLIEQSTALEVISQTVYPGTRRFAGALVDIGGLFNAPHLWYLQTDPPLVGTNSSEASTAYAMLALAAAMLVPAVDWRSRSFERRATIASIAAFLVLASWCLVAWPAWAEHLFPANVVAPGRVAQILGIPATLTFGLLLAAWRRAPLGRRLPTALSAAGAVFVITLVGGSAMRQVSMPTYPTEWIVVGALGSAALVGVAVAWASRSWALVPMALVAFAATMAVNPIQVGTGDLGSGRAVRSIQRGGASERWVSDDTAADALLMASGIPALSGQLWVGPDERAWRRLDPDEAAKQAWNRAASYITFGWLPSGSETIIDTPAPDMVRVQIDPCAKELDEFDVEWVLSSSELTDADCLRERDVFPFGGKYRHVYERTSGANAGA